MTSHRVLSPADYRRMPWKNGGGHTTEIAVHPADAGSASFVWRISVAEIDRNGPFSRFPGIDRTLVLLSGDGIRLTGAGDPMELQTPYEPVTFAGEAPIDCSLIGGPTRDFNLMVRRDAAHGEVIVVRESTQAINVAVACVCFSAADSSECLIPGHPPIVLGPNHALVLATDGAERTGLHVCPLTAASVALVAVIGAPGIA